MKVVAICTFIHCGHERSALIGPLIVVILVVRSLTILLLKSGTNISVLVVRWSVLKSPRPLMLGGPLIIAMLWPEVSCFGSGSKNSIDVLFIGWIWRTVTHMVDGDAFVLLVFVLKLIEKQLSKIEYVVNIGIIMENHLSSDAFRFNGVPECCESLAHMNLLMLVGESNFSLFKDPVEILTIIAILDFDRSHGHR